MLNFWLFATIYFRPPQFTRTKVCSRSIPALVHSLKTELRLHPQHNHVSLPYCMHARLYAFIFHLQILNLVEWLCKSIMNGGTNSQTPASPLATFVCVCVCMCGHHKALLGRTHRAPDSWGWGDVGGLWKWRVCSDEWAERVALELRFVLMQQ